jgi:hypothetical protein
MDSWTWAQALAVAGLIAAMTFGARSGYRRGPLRQLAAPLAALGALAAAAWVGPDLGHAWLGQVGVPWILRGPAGFLLAAAVIWLALLAILWRAGRPLAETGESESPVMGAMVGCWTGGLAWLTVMTAWGQHAAWERELRPATTPSRGSLAEIAELPGLAWLGTMEAWPETPREIIRAGRRVMADPAANRRLMENPRVRALASHPAFYTAWGDPEVKRLVRGGDYLGLLDHPKVQQLLADEGFQRELAAFELLGALRQALRE